MHPPIISPLEKGAAPRWVLSDSKLPLPATTKHIDKLKPPSFFCIFKLL